MLQHRILTAAILVPLFIWGTFSLAPPYFALLLAAFVLLGAWEWSHLAELPGVTRRIIFVLGVALVLIAAWFVVRRPEWLQLLLAATGIWWLGITFWIASGRMRERSAVQWSLRFRVTAGFVSLIPAWAAIVFVHFHPSYGPRMVFLLFAIVWGADSGAYLFGRLWGRRRLAPMISPGKTWEGVAGGLLVAGLLALVGGWYWEQELGKIGLFLILAIIVAGFSVIGDLFESALKRQANVKDSGHWLPGHGGVLDRVDSLTAAAPWFALGLPMTEIGATP